MTVGDSALQWEGETTEQGGFSQYLFTSTYTHVSDTVLGSADSTVNKTFMVTVLAELSASQEDMHVTNNTTV